MYTRTNLLFKCILYICRSDALALGGAGRERERRPSARGARGRHQQAGRRLMDATPCGMRRRALKYCQVSLTEHYIEHMTSSSGI